MKTRTIILSGMHNKQCLTAVLSIEGEDSLFCKLHSYAEFVDLCSLVLSDGKTEYYAQNLDLNVDYNFMVENMNIDSNFKIAICNSENECVLSNNLTQGEFEMLIEKNKTKAQSSDVDKKEEKIESEIQTEEKPETFFDAIALQFEEMFENNTRCNEVEALIPNSMWVSVDSDEENTKKYILGKIFDEQGNIKYVCYGEPAPNCNTTLNTVDPQFAQWLPLDPNNADSEGYFLLYQDAKTGETIKLD